MTPLPCPFCGSGEPRTLSELRLWWVACHTCAAAGPDAATEREAVSKWNEAMRALQPEVA